MTTEKLTDKTELTEVPADGDFIHVVDVSDTTGSAQGTSKKWKAINYLKTLFAPILGSDDNYVTDAEKIVIGNTSGSNTGDETDTTIKSKLGISTLSGSNTGDSATPAETATTIGTLLNSADEMTVPVDTDFMGIRKGTTGLWQKISWATLKSLFSAIFPVSAGKSGGQTIIGGTGVTDALYEQGTSGNGTATAEAWGVKVGNNGATKAISALNNGNVGIGTTATTVPLTIKYNNSSVTSPILTMENGTGSQSGFSFSFGGVLQSQIRADNAGTMVYASQGPQFFGYPGDFGIGVAMQFGGVMKVGSTGGLSVGSSYMATDPGNGNMIVQGNVLIGATSGSYNLTLANDSAGKPGVGGLWTVVSDERIKKDIVPADLARCYEIIKSVPLKYFSFADGVYTDEQVKDKSNLGWIAQDMQKVFPKAVSVKPFTLYPDIPDGEEEYEEQDFVIEQVENIQIEIIDGKPVQKVAIVKNKVLLFDDVDVMDESGSTVLEEVKDKDGKKKTKKLTYPVPRMIKKTRPKVRHDVIEDCLDLNSGQIIAALYGAVQQLQIKVEALESGVNPAEKSL